MARDLTRTEPIYVTAPEPHTGVAETLRRSLAFSYRASGQLFVYDLPSPVERHMLVERTKYLLGTLRQNRKQVGTMVADMLLGYRNAVKPGEDPDLVTALYVRELGLEPAIPTWAVAQACAKIRMGTAPDINLIYAPSTMALRRLCDSLVWDTRAELVRISQVLQARQATKEITEEERERIGQGFAKLSAELRARDAAVDGVAPITLDAMIEMAGGQEAWDALPDARRGAGQAIGSLAAKVAAA